MALSRFALSLVFVLGVAGVHAQEARKPAGDGEVASPSKGESRPYLAAGQSPVMSAILPPVPAPGSPTADADLAIFKATRALDGSPRWALAARDADDEPEALLKDFACAVGTDLDRTSTPALTHVVDRVLGDVEVAFRTAKADVKRLRPLVGNDLPICLPRTERLTNTYSYPSGHATRGWTVAQILAELAPDRATAILTRGRTYGESRVVCGVHWLSDVEAGRTVAAALVAALHGDAAFRADLDTARAELAAARAKAAAPDTTACKVEQDVASTGLR